MSQALIPVACHLIDELKDYFYWKDQVKIAKKARSLRTHKSNCLIDRKIQLPYKISNCFENNNICHDVLYADINKLCIHCKKIYLYTKYIQRCTAKANGIMLHLKHFCKGPGIHYNLMNTKRKSLRSFEERISHG